MKTMILAAGRGQRMRPLSDTCPKPLLCAGGKPLIVWQIEALARAGLRDIIINHAWRGQQIECALGDGSQFGVRLRYSPETTALGTAGGIAHALPLLGDGVFLAVSGDIYCQYDYRALLARAKTMAAAATPQMFLLMVANPAFHPQGDFMLNEDGSLSLEGKARLTFANIGLYDTRSFATVANDTPLDMLMLYRAAIAAGQVKGERFDGIWDNIGTPAQLAHLDTCLRQHGSKFTPPSA